MLIYLCNEITVDALRNHAAEEYIDYAFGIILDMEIHDLCGINNQHELYMVLTYEDQRCFTLQLIQEIANENFY